MSEQSDLLVDVPDWDEGTFLVSKEYHVNCFDPDML